MTVRANSGSKLRVALASSTALTLAIAPNFGTPPGSGGGGGGGSQPGQFTRPTYSSTPSQTEVERIYADRRLTRPDWWINGTTPLVVGVDTLPAGCSYDAGTNRITISGTVDDLSGWDFRETETTILMSSGSRINTFLHNRLCPRSIPKSDRVDYNNGLITHNPTIEFAQNSTASIGRMAYCWFTAGATHDGGPFWPTSHLKATANNNTGYAGVDLAEWNSFEGYGTDACKTVRNGVWRYNYYDCAWNIPEDAIDYVAGTYNAGDVVFSLANSAYLRLCVNNGVTSAPDWSSKLANTADWKSLDPHSDQDQVAASPDGTLIEWLGNFSTRDQGRRRHPSRQLNRGIVNWLRAIVNNPANQDIGKMWVHHNIMTDEVEASSSNTNAIELASLADSYGDVNNTKILEDNFYQTLLCANTGTHITIQNNTSGWTFPAAATLSGVALDANTAAATLAFTPTRYGWMRVVFTTTQGALTAAQILAATVSGAVKAVVEVDADPNTAMLAVGAISGVAQGTTLYAYGLFQSGGGTDTLTGEQSTTVAALPTTLAITEPTQSGMPYPEAAATGQADVKLVLTGTANAYVEIKDYRTDTPTGYTYLGRLDGTGNLATTFKAVPQTGRLFSPQVRLRDNTAVTDTMTKTVGVGPNFGFESQSIIGNPLAQNDSGITVSGPGVIMDSENNDQLLEFNGATSWGRCSAKMANVFLALGNQKHAYGAWFFVYSGKSMLGLLDDAYDVARNFDPTAKDMTDRLAAHGTHLSQFMIMHGGADIINAQIADHETIYTPAMIGKHSTANGGATVTVGETVSSPTRSFAADRVFLDASGTRTAAQVVVPDTTKCKLVICRNWNLPGGDVTNTDGDFQGSNSQKQWEAFENIATRAVSEGMDAVASGLVTYQTDGGFTHPLVGVEGHEQVFVELAIRALAGAGEITVTVPRITGVSWTTTIATVQFDTPLTTQDMTNAVDQVVTGFELSQGAGWYLAGITATIVGDGSTGQIEVTGTSNFANGHQLRYNAGGAAGYWAPTTQVAANRHRKVLRNPNDAQLSFDHYGTAAASDGTAYTATGI